MEKYKNPTIRYIIEIKVRVQNCTKHFEAREEILGDYYDHITPLQRADILKQSVDSLRESLLPEIKEDQ